jgi:hypothetical protein
MSNGRAPVRRIQIGFGPSGATTPAKWCQLGNTAHIPFPPMALLRLFICSPSALRHSAGDFAPLLIILAGSDSPLDDNPSPTVGTYHALEAELSAQTWSSFPRDRAHTH